MARYSGLIGFTKGQLETSPGVWEESYDEHAMTGNITQQSFNAQNGEVINTGVVMSNTISVVGDTYSFENYSNIRYAEYLGQKWRVASVEVVRPRIIIQLGTVYNE